MNVELVKIAGLSSDLAGRLKKAGISDARALAEATDTIEKRKTLAAKVGESSLVLYNLAKQAELLRCEAVDPEEAEALVRAGIRGIEDLKSADVVKLANYLFDNGINTDIDEDDAVEWGYSALGMTSSFQPEPSDKVNADVLAKTNVGVSLARSSAYGSDLSDIITELGVGIAQAQKNLDQASLAIQREILKDPELSALGFNATWYAIPEVSFTLKMEYTYSETGERRISVVPMNASYNNAFRSERAEESTLNLRFVPVPAPEGLTERVTVPDFLGMTREKASETALGLGLKVEFVQAAGIGTVDQPTMVTRQSIAAGTLVHGQQLIRISYVEGTPTELLRDLVVLVNYRLMVARERLAELELKFNKPKSREDAQKDPEYQEYLVLKYGVVLNSEGSGEQEKPDKGGKTNKTTAKETPSKQETPAAEPEPEPEPQEEPPEAEKPDSKKNKKESKKGKSGSKKKNK